MKNNPFVNAIAASGYIVAVAILMTFVSTTQRNKPDTFMAPVLVLSVLTLSVAVMAYLFFYQPVQLFLEGKKKQATNLFLKTIAVFAGITVLVVVFLSLGVVGF